MKDLINKLKQNHGSKPALLDDELIEFVGGVSCGGTCEVTCEITCEKTCANSCTHTQFTTTTN